MTEHQDPDPSDLASSNGKIEQMEQPSRKPLPRSKYQASPEEQAAYARSHEAQLLIGVPVRPFSKQ